ncbi:MAG: pantoate--beta-alanine ligase [Steroidobacteraceae bacterium]
MRVIHRIAELRGALAGCQTVVLVPTVGNLHAGHLSLIERAAAGGRPVVASIFVNRLQFAPQEDFDRYPRTLAADCKSLRSAGCDIVFAPSEAELYPEPQVYRLHPPAALAGTLEGRFRPDFFTGVCTIVLKLFNIVRPATAYFGKKDYQQWLVIRHMVSQCALPIEIVGAETVREASGLALSSRNGYLPSGRLTEAASMYRELECIAAAIRAGRTDYSVLGGDAREALQERGWAVDYLTVCRRADLGPPTCLVPLVVVAAATLDSTRLIDNVEI